MQELYAVLLSFQTPKRGHNACEKGGRCQSKKEACDLAIFQFCC